MYFVIKPSVPVVLINVCFTEYVDARKAAAQAGAIVTNDSWLAQNGNRFAVKHSPKGKLVSVSLNGSPMELFSSKAS